MRQFREFKSEQQYVTEIGPIAATLAGVAGLVGGAMAAKKLVGKFKSYKEAKKEKEENSTEENIDKNPEESDGDDLESIIKLKEETDSWLIEKLKNKDSSESSEELRKDVEELKARVEKLEKIIVNLTNAFA